MDYSRFSSVAGVAFIFFSFAFYSSSIPIEGLYLGSECHDYDKYL